MCLKTTSVVARPPHQVFGPENVHSARPIGLKCPYTTAEAPVAAVDCQTCWKRAMWSSVRSVRIQRLRVLLRMARAWTLLCRLQHRLMLRRQSKR